MGNVILTILKFLWKYRIKPVENYAFSFEVWDSTSKCRIEDSCIADNLLLEGDPKELHFIGDKLEPVF